MIRKIAFFSQRNKDKEQTPWQLLCWFTFVRFSNSEVLHNIGLPCITKCRILILSSGIIAPNDISIICHLLYDPHPPQAGWSAGATDWNNGPLGKCLSVLLLNQQGEKPSYKNYLEAQEGYFKSLLDCFIIHMFLYSLEKGSTVLKLWRFF